MAEQEQEASRSHDAGLCKGRFCVPTWPGESARQVVQCQVLLGGFCRRGVYSHQTISKGDCRIALRGGRGRSSDRLKALRPKIEVSRQESLSHDFPSLRPTSPMNFRLTSRHNRMG